MATNGESTATLPADLRLGPTHLTVTDLDRSIGFYQDSLGLQQHTREGDTAAMGAGGEDLLVLHEDPSAQPAGRHAGLYHFALLHPSREELSHAARRLATTQTPISGASDHGVSEAIYLPDPDGNGIELYFDRPRDQWPAPSPGERVAMFTAPLDLQDLLSLAAAEEDKRHSDPGLVMGHMHLHVGDLAEAIRFYRDVLGFNLMTEFPPSAGFLAAGDYHHHLGVNTWRGEGVPPAPDNAVGLRRWSVVLPSEDDVDAVRERVNAAGVESEDADGALVVRDPWNHELLITAEG